MTQGVEAALDRFGVTRARGAATAAGSWLTQPVLRVVARRLGLAVPLLFVVSALSFLLISLAPGNAVISILGTTGTPASYARLRHQLGLDQPLYVQYWDWLRRALHGDLGRSLLSGEPVSRIITERFPVTLSLVAGALLVTVVVGVSLGVFSAVRGGIAGRVVDALSLVSFSLPAFWIGAVLIAVFAVDLHWLPAVGYVPLASSPGHWARALVLPVTALALHHVAVVAKQTREAMLDVLASEHIRVARANGLRPFTIYFVLALRNAAMRVVTVLGLQTVGLLGGTLFVEQVFALPGLGYVLVNSSLQHDLPVVQGVTVFFTLIIVGVNLAVDLAYTWLNPRVRTS